ncbi:MAG: hypothetical protein ACXVO9_06815, partial [Bacteroidia bacterium]
IQTKPVDYFIFGHRHLPLDMDIDGRSRYINLGEWINYRTYAVFDGSEVSLLKYTPNTSQEPYNSIH